MDILITALTAGSLLLAEHYAPWRLVLRRKLPRIVAYILGVLALVVPLTVLYALWAAWQAVLALWVVTLAGGAVVLACYALDDWLSARADLHAEAECRRALKEANHD